MACGTAPRRRGGRWRCSRSRSRQRSFFDRPEREADFRDLIQAGCPDRIARLIVMGTTYTSCPFRKRTFDPTEVAPYAYVAGPMRSLPFFNFPTFDEVRDQLVKSGYNVISPADIDRAAGDTDATNQTAADQRDYVFRDFWTLYFLAKKGKHSADRDAAELREEHRRKPPNWGWLSGWS